MSKFASRTPVLTSPVTTTGVVGVTEEGGVGYERDAKSELFLLAVTNMVSEDTFYESGAKRDARYEALIAQVTREDPAWVRAFVPFLRDRLHLRSASLVMAAEYVRAGGEGGRRVIADALQRADEPAEMLAYWTSRHGRSVPKPVKRGVADAVARLYDERAVLKYDGQDAKWRMADVLDLVHPRPRLAWQALLFRYLLAKRHKRDDLPTETLIGGVTKVRVDLPTIAANMALEALPITERRAVLADPERLKAAAFTWERLSGWLQGPMDAQAWEAIIPSMGYMALLRNLRNFEDAKVSAPVRDAVIARLADPEQVQRSRQLPLRFYSAWKATGSMTYGPAIETALDLSLANVPSFTGRTLVLIDISGSMDAVMSARSKALRWELAGLFGIAVGTRAEHSDVYAYSNAATRIVVRESTSILRAVDALRQLPHGGTQTWDVVQATFKGHDRIVIVTDEQAFAPGYSALWGASLDQSTVRPDQAVPATVPTYTFNVAGYKMGHAPAGRDNRYTFGGLTDAAFDLIPLLEQHRSGDWSFLAA